MENLTDILLTDNFQYQVEETVKQGGALSFGSGREQRMVSGSIPAHEIVMSYHGLDWEKYKLLREAYENNNSNTFIVDFSDKVSDLRKQLLTIDGSVFAFKSFRFKISKNRLYDGRITLVTSVFFNFPEYQERFDQSSHYTKSPTDDDSFIKVLATSAPYSVDLYYHNNAIFSNIGKSARHIRNKGGLKRAWTLNWLLTEINFLKLLKFYRQQSGIMGEFGVFDYGFNAGYTIPYIDDDYIENQNGVDGYFEQIGFYNVSNARFLQDSLKYQKRIDGLITCRAELLEVKV